MAVYPKIKIFTDSEENSGVLNVYSKQLISLTEGFQGYTNPAGIPILETRELGSLKYNGFWLTDMYDWVLVVDEMGMIVLVPLKKEDH